MPLLASEVDELLGISGKAVGAKSGRRGARKEHTQSRCKWVCRRDCHAGALVIIRRRRPDRAVAETTAKRITRYIVGSTRGNQRHTPLRGRQSNAIVGDHSGDAANG